VTANSCRPIRCFGPFRLNIETGELWKSRTRIRLQGQPLQILLCLLEEPGRFRTREELRSKLWPNGTFVDFDHSLNVAINRLRERLGDSAENPLYIETVAGVGYRFIKSVETSRSSPAASLQTEVDLCSQSPLFPKRALLWGSVIVVCMLVIGLSTWSIAQQASIQRALLVQPPIDSIAVLPLANLTRGEGDDYLSDGVTEELITELARMGQFRVISRTSIMSYKGAARPISEIGRELKVNALVEGTLRRSGDRIRITVQLVGISPERHIWADAFEGDINNVLNLERDVARDIAARYTTGSPRNRWQAVL
jgi:TolB-like protein/DNA-binding winged helix-turn-helix (wHTH) protein